MDTSSHLTTPELGVHTERVNAQITQQSSAQTPNRSLSVQGTRASRWAACDRCARLKQACIPMRDRLDLCERCHSRRRRCTFLRPGHPNATQGLLAVSLLSVGHGQTLASDSLPRVALQPAALPSPRQTPQQLPLRTASRQVKASAQTVQPVNYPNPSTERLAQMFLPHPHLPPPPPPPHPTLQTYGHPENQHMYPSVEEAFMPVPPYGPYPGWSGYSGQGNR